MSRPHQEHPGVGESQPGLCIGSAGGGPKDGNLLVVTLNMEPRLKLESDDVAVVLLIVEREQWSLDTLLLESVQEHEQVHVLNVLLPESVFELVLESELEFELESELVLVLESEKLLLLLALYVTSVLSSSDSSLMWKLLSLLLLLALSRIS